MQQKIKTPIISIIVPCYNVESYLQECVDSVFKQTYDNWELILIDDGSNDNTPLLCDNFAQKDNRVKVIHKKNGGLVSARNVGYEHVTGEWMTYLDSDDWVSENMVEQLTKVILSNKDLNLIFWCMVQELGKKTIKNKWNWDQYESGSLYLKEENIKMSSYVLNYKSGLSDAVCKLYKTDWCKRYGLFHNPSLKQGEESVDFVMRAFYYADKSMFLKEYFYHYRFTPTSISKKVDENNAVCIVDCMNVMSKFINEIPNNSLFLKEFDIRNAYVLMHVAMHTFFNPMYKCSYKERVLKFEEIVNNNYLFLRAIKNVKYKEFDKLRMITLWCIKKKRYRAVDFIGIVKHLSLKMGFFKY